MSISAEPIPVRIVTCPGCGGEAVYAVHNPWRPFCSARCRANDFGAWASETFAIEARSEPPALDQDDAPTP